MPRGYAGYSSEIGGVWKNPYGNVLVINGDGRRAYLSGDCFAIAIEPQGKRQIVTHQLETANCIPREEGESGALDAVRAALLVATQYKLEAGNLTFLNDNERILAIFDRVAS